ncbi:MAG: gluconate 2-dehydrogenase subunit 3 family protein [Pseudonocardiales bacterium]|nr:gluconate 2-dehydrogenase subunit 3 family protein [Pseudonocardiales bacterium]
MLFRAPSRHALTPGGQGRFPGFDVLDQVKHWDELTAGVVLARLQPPAELGFFTVTEALTAAALFDLLLGQHTEPRVPVLHLVDARLAANETDGWRYEDLPEDRQAWRDTLAALDRNAVAASSTRFPALDLDQQGRLVQSVQDADQWHGWEAAHVWSLWTRYACAAFYSHPWAWNEIGFGGPAYPRGYKAIGVGKREGWEVAEHDARDPVPWAARVEQARRAHRPGGGGTNGGASSR